MSEPIRVPAGWKVRHHAMKPGALEAMANRVLRDAERADRGVKRRLWWGLLLLGVGLSLLGAAAFVWFFVLP